MKIIAALFCFSYSIAYAQDSLDPAILEATRKGDEPAIRRWLARNPPIDARGQDGMTALLAAAQANQEKIVKLLTDSGADVNARDDDGASALLLASISAGPQVVRLLLDRGAHLADAPARPQGNRRADLEDPYMPLMYMTVKGQRDNVIRMLAAGADPNHAINGRSLAMYASEHDWAALVDVLDRAAHPNPTEGPVRDPFHRGYTPLMLAAARGDAREFDHLLATGADWHAVTASHTSVLMFAAQGGNVGNVDTLLRRGAKGGEPNAAGWTAVMYAAVLCDSQIFRTLLSARESGEVPEDDAGSLVWASVTPEIRQWLVKWNPAYRPK